MRMSDRRKSIEHLKIPETIRIPVFGGLWYQYLSRKENEILNDYKLREMGVNSEHREIKVTASLTSFPARINYVHIAIKSLLLQSYKPDRVILWLANEQFLDSTLPQCLTELINYGLEIKWCDDLYGHKKYYYCIKEQQENEVVITFDDDIIYPIDAIKRLVEKHKEFPNCLICERAQAIDYDERGKVKNPGNWKTISDIGYKLPSYSLNPSPGGGCLIPYNGFYKDAIDEQKIRALAYKNDDLWYMFMAAENGTRTIKTQKYHKIFTLINGSQVTQMAIENVVGNKNLEIMDKLRKAYPIAYRRILTDID